MCTVLSGNQQSRVQIKKPKCSHLSRETVVTYVSDGYYQGHTWPQALTAELRNSSVLCTLSTPSPHPHQPEYHSSCEWFSFKELDETFFMAPQLSPSLPVYFTGVRFLFPCLTHLSFLYASQISPCSANCFTVFASERVWNNTSISEKTLFATTVYLGNENEHVSY